jgi:hypothetical protein
MVARTQPAGGLLLVTFTRDPDEVEEVVVADGMDAAAAGISMIARRVTLQPGDSLNVRQADNEEPPDVPEVSRSAHYS